MLGPETTRAIQEKAQELARVSGCNMQHAAAAMTSVMTAFGHSWADFANAVSGGIPSEDASVVTALADEEIAAWRAILDGARSQPPSPTRSGSPSSAKNPS